MAPPRRRRSLRPGSQSRTPAAPGPHCLPNIDPDPDGIPAKEEPIDVDGMEYSFDEAGNDDVAYIVGEEVDEESRRARENTRIGRVEMQLI